MEETILKQKRLRTLMDHLARVNDNDPESFDLTAWHNGKISGALDAHLEGRSLSDCGFSGCVVGHMPLLFPEDFKWGRGDNGVWDIDVVHLRHGNRWEVACSDEVAMYFGGSGEQWMRIIHRSYYTSREHLEPVHAVKSIEGQSVLYLRFEVKLPAVLRRLEDLYENLHGSASSDDNDRVEACVGSESWHC